MCLTAVLFHISYCAVKTPCLVGNNSQAYCRGRQKSLTYFAINKQLTYCRPYNYFSQTISLKFRKEENCLFYDKEYFREIYFGSGELDYINKLS